LGNYQHYYSKRVGPHARVDPRLALFDPAWFREKKVLDVGCNAGFLTICVGQFMGPRIIEGVDIDIGLVRKARGQLVHRGSIAREEGADLDEVEGGGDAMDVVAETQGPDLDSYDYFPESAIYSYSEIPLIHHPTASATPDTQPSPSFPSNVTFRCGDWLHEPNPSSSDQIYDTLLALSVNKWIHLNHGDAGLKLFFRKSLNSLKKGGIFILEVQPFTSYRKRGLNLTEEMSNHYRQIKLKPEGFKVYL
ncbi:Bicoid-interacting protein 3-domain-containing protein, partial [Phlyctochytrium arcticum]